MPRHRIRRSVLPVSLTAAALLAASAAGGAYLVGRAPDRAPAAVASVSSASPASSSASPEASEEPVVDLDAELAGAVEPLLGAVPPAALSVAVLDSGSGARAVYGGAAKTYETASIVKVDILAALLLRAQDEGRGLTAAERARAAAMIENSDNDSATALLAAVGGAAGLDAAKAAVGVLEAAR